ncbi:MAG: tetratricopeptide repeat protein [Xanthobacteraceae bacterium]
MSRAASQDHVLAKAVQLHQAGDLAGAIRLYEKVVRKAPSNAVALNFLGLACFQNGELEQAASSINRALSLKPDLPDADFHLGIIFHAMGRHEEAARHLTKAIAAKPDDADARSTLGTVLRELGRDEEAIEQCRKAIALKPDLAGAYVNLGNALFAINLPLEAIQQYHHALRIDSLLPEAHVCLSTALIALDRFEEAIGHCERVLVLKSDSADAHMSLGDALVELGRRAEASQHYRQAVAVDPDHKFAFGKLANASLAICDWSNFSQIRSELELRVKQNRSHIEPLAFLLYSGDAALHRQCSTNAIRIQKLENLRLPSRATVNRRDRIRVAYLSSDFRSHATSYLIAELFELHDRERFEIVGVSTGPDDKSEIRARVIKSFDQFHDVRFRSDGDIAELLRDLEIDILVDLNGHTARARLGILARHLAPVQVNYLGYPGTIGADFIDYVIADRIVLPLDQQPLYCEKIVQLPDSYQVNDRQRKISSHVSTRRDVGLPKGFVFCCFNKADKITPFVFDVWMRILKQVDGAVLWLIADEAARLNLRAEAAARGVDPGALVFAGRVAPEDHLARYRLADLFLDTLPYNAHTTASDALWAGLPVVTCMGSAFAGRVAASLLHAVGLPELVTESLDDYEALAAKLATEPARLDGIRETLARNRETHPLFDTVRFCRHLESAYVTMLELAERGEAPRGFAVQPI